MPTTPQDRADRFAERAEKALRKTKSGASADGPITIHGQIVGMTVAEHWQAFKDRLSSIFGRAEDAYKQGGIAAKMAAVDALENVRKAAEVAVKNTTGAIKLWFKKMALNALRTTLLWWGMLAVAWYALG